MIANAPSRDSEATLMERIHTLSDAGGSLIQVRTREPMRATQVLRKHFLNSDSPYKEWDVVNGFRVFTKENFTDNRVAGGGEDFLAALMKPLEELRSPTSAVNADTAHVHYVVYLDPHPYTKDNPFAAELMQQYASILPTTNVCIILVTPEITLDNLPAGTVLVADMPTPGVDELCPRLQRTLTGTIKEGHFSGGVELDDEDIRRAAVLGLGLSLYEFETYTAITIIEALGEGNTTLTLDRMLEGIGKGKTAVVRQSEILELTHAESIENIGGMGRLKSWLRERAGCYSDAAKEFGIEPPKGMVLVGVAGTGKSLAAKVTASVLGIPLVRLDFGRVFSKYVGDSESRVRAALKMVEDMAPVVLFVDEIDKGLGGAGGGGDSGTSSRVLGSYLTWLQECKAPVFSVVTANQVTGLPPELLRRGRFDQVFSVTLPNEEERREVLGIHLRKRGRDIESFNESDLKQFDDASRGYVPAEIESAVKDGIIAAFNGGKKSKGLTMEHITTALRDMVPMSKSHKEVVDRIVAWANENATPVSAPAKKKPISLLSGGSSPRRSIRRV